MCINCGLPVRGVESEDPIYSKPFGNLIDCWIYDYPDCKETWRILKVGLYNNIFMGNWIYELSSRFGLIITDEGIFNIINIFMYITYENNLFC